MKRKYAEFVVMLTFTLLIGLQVVETKDNPLVTKAAYPYTSAINILEPKNTTYFSEENLTLEVNFTAWVNYNINYFVTYILDGENDSIIVPYEYIVPANHSWEPFVGIIKGSVALPKLSEGIHNITVLGQAHIGMATTNSSSSVTFTVNSLAQPTPYELLPPSTIAPSENYSVPPLSSLNLKVIQPYGSAIGGLIYIKGGNGNDINFRVINSQGKNILDLGRISNEKSFQFFADKTGNFTFIFDNEFSVFSSKEVDVFSYSYPNNLFEFAGFSINFWTIILVAILFVTLMALVVWLIKHKQKLNHRRFSNPTVFSRLN